MLSFARLRRAEGLRAEAVELAALVDAHPATDPLARTAAAALRVELAAELPADEVQAAEGRGRAEVLADSVARLREGARAVDLQPA